uniref:Uncharacterized protein n=1 Tax=Heterosigma akashiwo TaxID=2829 RepID=A0A6V1PAK9_HETAK|mmetsp:Transcript_36978/g.57732  ORF Transcript_36978/g.57732 Transcript_36978/m.57732 type:complete len:311 (+) Transcript_36978:130-1062(+)
MKKYPKIWRAQRYVTWGAIQCLCALIFFCSSGTFILAREAGNASESKNIIVDDWLKQMEENAKWEHLAGASNRESDGYSLDQIQERLSPEYLKLRKELISKAGLKAARKDDGKRIRRQALKIVVLGYSWSGLAKSCKTPQELLTKTRVASGLTLLASGFLDYRTQKYIKRTVGAAAAPPPPPVAVARQSFVGYWKGKTPVEETVPCLKHDLLCLEFTRRATVLVAVLGLLLSLALRAPTLLYLGCALGAARYLGEPLVLAALLDRGKQLRRPLQRPGRLAVLLGAAHYSVGGLAPAPDPAATAIAAQQEP